MAIADAVRIQAKCDVNGVLICDETYVKLSKKRRLGFGPVIQIKGKPHEKRKISVRQWARM
jgi:hypothetical protein